MLKAWVAVAALVGAVAVSPPAYAAPLCEHRSSAHVDRHSHGSVSADSRWHVAHGQRPTCKHDGGHHGGDSHHRRDRGSLDHHPNFHLGKDRHRWWRND